MSASHLRIRLGSAIAEKVGNPYISLPKQDEMTASQLRVELSSKYPEAAPLINMAVIFSNGSPLNESDPVPGGEIVVLNPIAGG